MSPFEGGEAPPKTRSTCTSTCTSAQTSLVSNFNSICCWKLDAEFIISWTNLQFSSPISHRVSTSWSQHWGDVVGGGGLTYTSLSIAVQHKLHVTRTLGAVVRLLADVLATAVAVVTSHYQRGQS